MQGAKDQQIDLGRIIEREPPWGFFRSQMLQQEIGIRLIDVTGACHESVFLVFPWDLCNPKDHDHLPENRRPLFSAWFPLDSSSTPAWSRPPPRLLASLAWHGCFCRSSSVESSSISPPSPWPGWSRAALTNDQSADFPR